MNAMRVLWISPGFAADEHDDSCIPPMQLLATALKEKGVDLQILTLAYPSTRTTYIWKGIPVYPGIGWNRSWFRLANWIRVINKASGLHRQRKIDVIHSFWLGPSWLIGRYLKWRHHIPHITTLMGQDVLQSNIYLKFINKNDTDSLVTLSEFHRLKFGKVTGMLRVPCIGWGIPQNEIRPELSSFRPIDILGCGSLIPVKNWPLWIDMVSRIILKYPDLHAEIIGNGPEMNQLEQQIVMAGIQNNVKLQGKLSRKQVLQKMQQSKILLHTSKFESFGMVLLEAASSGCRVISTPVGIAPEIGLCAEGPDELVELIDRALVQTPLEKIQAIPTMDQTVSKYMEMYHHKIDLIAIA
jgi:glycosyltransferase involved in cell wall biosynthesis